MSKEHPEDKWLNGSACACGFGLLDMVMGYNYDSYAPYAYSKGNHGGFLIVIGWGMLVASAILFGIYIWDGTRK